MESFYGRWCHTTYHREHNRISYLVTQGEWILSSTLRVSVSMLISYLYNDPLRSLHGLCFGMYNLWTTCQFGLQIIRSTELFTLFKVFITIYLFYIDVFKFILTGSTELFTLLSRYWWYSKFVFSPVFWYWNILHLPNIKYCCCL